VGIWGAGMSEWRNTTLGDFVSLQRGHDLTDPERKAGNVPVMGSAGQNGVHCTALAKGPGVVIGRSGASFGQVHFAQYDYWPHNTCLYVTDFHGNDPRFAYYFLKSINFAGYNSGSAQPSLNRNFIYPIEITVPSPETQREIARVLATLDDKIELNRRMNETLEAMARAIFQSWFVDFDPVRAKASGESADSICQRLGLTPELLALFPESFDESVLGEVPAGWVIESIGTLANVTGGSTPNTKEPRYWDDGVHYWATPKDLSRLSSPVLLGTERKVSDEGLAQIGSGLLKPGAVLLSSRAPIGYRAINEVPVAVNQGFIVMTPNSGVSKYFLLYWAEWAHDEIVSRANGSTFLEISRTNFRPIPVVRPADAFFEKFDQYVGPLYKRIVSNEQETQLLVAQRDSLLPKLLSGEVLVAVEEEAS
jgi:type I restriction enzyme S subunit